MSSHNSTRVIPRPSQRRSAGVRIPGAAIDLREQTETVAQPRHSNEQTSREQARRTSAYTVAAVSALAAALAFGGLGLSGRENTTFGLVVAPVLTLIVFMVLGRWAKPIVGTTTVAILVAGFGLRMLGAVPRFIGGADSPIYQREGERIAASLRALDLGVDTGRSIPGTGSVRYLSGVVNVLTGSNYITTFLIFASIAFAGQVFFLLGARRALNSRQFRILVVLTMFSPTLAYWPSSIGKESLALFGIGLGTLGAAKMYERDWAGIAPMLAGSFAVGMVRPHVAMVLLAGVLVGLFARRAHTRGRLASHSLLLLVVIVGSMIMAGSSASLFGLESFDGVSDVNAALDFAQERTSQDESRFVAARVSSPLGYPWAAVTVLFRPFPWEASNAPAMISAAESAILILLLLRAGPGLLARARELVERGQLLFPIAFIAVFVFVFSAIGNFGILSRQRAQVVPFLLLVVAFGMGVDHRRARRQP